MRKGAILAITAALSMVPVASSSAKRPVVHGPRGVARYVGAEGGPTPADWRYANSRIGPLHADKIFYPGALPRRWPRGNYGLTHDALAIIDYKTPSVHLISFVRSIPRRWPVTLVYLHHVEAAGVKAFVFRHQFAYQYRLVHSVGRSNVKVAMDASAYRYRRSFPTAYSCRFIPSARYVDYYYVSVYEPHDTTLQKAGDFRRWLHCVISRGRPLGVSEYGVGICGGTALRAQTLAADARYLRRFDLQTFVYWWDGHHRHTHNCTDNWKFTDPRTIRVWRDEMLK